MRIIYYASDYNMGDTSSVDCDRFRGWARERLEKRYPNSQIMVVNAPSLNQCEVVFNNVDEIDFRVENDIQGFCAQLWDKMDW